MNHSLTGPKAGEKVSSDSKAPNEVFDSESILWNFYKNPNSSFLEFSELLYYY